MSAALFKKAKQKALYLAILGLFSSGANGVFLDANDWANVCFQDAAGTTPVTAMEQPVGLVLDKSQGLAQVAVNPNAADRTFTSDTGFWTKGGNTTIGGGACTFNGTGSYIYIGSLVVGAWYRAVITVGRYTSGAAMGISASSTGAAPLYGTITLANNTTTTVWFQATSSTLGIGSRSFSVDMTLTNVVITQIAGNHAYQSTSANRPVITARYNLLTKTEDISNGAYTSAGSASITANTFTENTSNSLHRVVQGGTLAAGISCTARCVLSKGTRRYVIVSVVSGYSAFFCVVDTSVTPMVITDTGTAAGQGDTYTSSSVVSNGDGTYTVTITGALSVSGPALNISGSTGSTATVGAPTYTGDGSTFIVTKLDLRPSDQATGLIPTYQRVNTATDYDTVGFPVREAYNGSNQLLGGASGGGATTGFFFCAGVMITKVGAAQTLFSDTGTNTGWRVRINASNQLELSAGNGTTYTTVATVGTVPINKLTVVTAWHDGTNLNVQINQGAVAQAAFAVATAGTAGYTLGCDNGASTNYLQGSLGEIVYRTGTAMNAAQIATTQAFVNSKQKAY